MPREASQTVLDVVTYIQRALDPTLAYRFACRVGMCGSCAMMVNGVPRWTCRTHVDKVAGSGTLELAPLKNLPVIRDLVSDMREFFDKWARAKGEFRGRSTREDDFAKVRPDSAPRKQADAGIECIGCAVCYAACDVVAWNPRIPRAGRAESAWTLVQDERDSDTPSACAPWPATPDATPATARELHRALPQALSPTAAIAGLKREVTKAVLHGDL